MTPEETNKLDAALAHAEDAYEIDDLKKFRSVLEAVKILAAEVKRLRKEDDDLRKLL